MGQASRAIISRPARLAAVRQLGLLDILDSPAFDRLTSLAARVLHAPISLVSFVDEERQFFTSVIGLGEPWATQRETPLSHSFCHYVVESGEPLIIADAREHPLYHDNLAISAMGFVAYAGVPLTTPDGQRLGSFCVIDNLPRTWTEAEIDLLRDLSALANTEIKVLVDNIERTQAEATARRQAEQHKRLLEVAQTVVSSLALDEILPQLQRTFQMVVAHDALSIYWLDAAAGLLRPAHQIAPIWRSDHAGSWPIPIDSGLAGAVARSGRAEMVNNAQLDPRSVYPPGTTDPPEHHQISIPFQVNNQVRGVFLMHRTSGEPFTEQEFELAQIFMSFASLAIENARLFEQTKLAEEHQRLLIEQVPCRLWTTDHELRFTSSVGITPRELQLPPSSILGMSIYELFETDDPQMLPITAHRRALAGEPSAYDLVWHGRVFQSHVQPFRDAQGQLVGCIGVALDITERRQIEEALRESQTLLQGIVDHSPMSIVIQDVADGRYLLVNRSLAVLAGLTVEQLIGKTITELYPPEAVALWRAQDRSIAITRQSMQVEDDIRHSDGTLRTSLGIKFPLYDAKGDVYAIGGIFTDITDRKRAEQEREQLIDALQEALANIKTLRGMLPICASCKKIRDDSGYWSQIEAYVQAHSDAVFSHGICPDCARQLYGDLIEE